MPSRGALPQGDGLFFIFLPHPSSPARRFSKITPVPSLASPKSFTLGNVQMHLSLHSLNQDFIDGLLCYSKREERN